MWTFSNWKDSLWNIGTQSNRNMYEFNLFSSFHQCSTIAVNVYLKIHLKFKSVTYNENLMIFKQIDAWSFDSFEMQYEFPDLSAIIEPTICVPNI